MEKRGKIQKLTSFLLVFVMLLGVIFQGQSVFAEGVERVESKITDFTVATSSGEIPPEGFSLNSALRIGISWDASYYGYDLKEGDYFNVTLPKEFIFPADHSACNFDIKTPDGTDVVAKAVVTPGDEDNGGGTIRVTFTQYVEDKHNIKGSMFLNATFNKKYIKTGQENVIAIAIGSQIVPIVINVKPINNNPLNEETLSKWSRNKLFAGYVRWDARINHKKGNLTNVVITDELSSEDGDLTGIHYKKDSFRLMEINADAQGNVSSHGPIIDISNNVIFSDNDTKFRYELGNISGKQYFLMYDTTYKPNIKLHNKVTLANEQQTWTSSSSAVFAESGGQGSGDLLSKIKIIKVDSEDNEIKLAGAIFEVTRLSDNTTFTLTTNSEGEILSDKLLPGKYKIKETTQPVGYILNDETFEVDVKADGVCIQTIKNEPVKTNITVEKRWIGEAGAPVTAILKADGTEVARHELTAATSWKHTFENLRKYQPGTDTEIVYTVEEETVPQGYTVSYETDPTGILVIKNTQDKTEVKVTKAWEDNNDQDGKRPASVTIKLLADGEEVSGKTLTLTEANNWTGTFTDLVKYKAGKKIKYTIKEESVGNGYVSAITGSAEDGYKITNTREPEKINVEGKKTWNDKDNQDGKRPAEITINLLKNGAVVETKTITEADGWKWKFEGLDKYENGNEITYS
ncbi:MAG: Cna B-type domain-containing protein, partial [Gallibacter sp.]|nr:Cna B-type domain-containing protein [Gallibacter sp.]